MTIYFGVQQHFSFCGYFVVVNNNISHFVAILWWSTKISHFVAISLYVVDISRYIVDIFHIVDVSRYIVDISPHCRCF